MKKIAAFLFVVLVFQGCNEKNRKLKEQESIGIPVTYCNEIKFKSHQIQADSLINFYKLAEKAERKELEKLEQLFFCAFPDTFEKMDILFGHSSENGPGPLYFEPGGAMISYFNKLKTVPREIYYEKYINICIDGVWKADNIRVAFGIATYIIDDTTLFCKILKMKTEEEISSVFRFIFDGPHPDNDRNHTLYAQLYSALHPVDAQLAELLKTSFDKLLKDAEHWH